MPSTRYRETLILAIPLVGSNLAQAVKHLTDVVMLGWYGVDELAAGVLATTLWSMLFIIGAGFSMATISFASRAAGERDRRKIRRSIRTGCWIAMTYCLVVAPLMWEAELIFDVLGQQEHISDLATTYLRIAMWGIIPALLTMTLKAFFLALIKPQIILWATIAGAILNAFLNYVLIFGNWGAPEWGMQGAAIASLIAHSFTLSLMIGYILLVPVCRPYRLLTRFWQPDWTSYRELFNLGWPISATLIAESLFFSASAIMVGWIDTVTLAAHGIVIEIAAFVFMIYLGLANAGTAQISRAVGSNNLPELNNAVWSVIKLTLGAVFINILLFAMFPETLVSSFLDTSSEDSAKVLQIGQMLIYVAAMFQLADALQVILLGLLRGLEDTRVPMIIAAVCYVCVGIPLSYGIGFLMDYGAMGIWIGFIGGLGLAALFFAYRLRWKIALLHNHQNQ